jgi:hypothetical protein
MGRVAAIMCVLVLAACGERRSFDERYNNASAELEQRARTLDRKLANELAPAEKVESPRR